MSDTLPTPHRTPNSDPLVFSSLECQMLSHLPDGRWDAREENPIMEQVNQRCMDKSKITRKQSKTSKHGHENQKSSKRSQRIKAEARKAKPQSKSIKPQSNPVKDGQ
ncbi:hypothetical protein Tco_0767447 [Tanacetum coccineum]